jgi:hypothetical protein
MRRFAVVQVLAVAIVLSALIVIPVDSSEAYSTLGCKWSTTTITWKQSGKAGSSSDFYGPAVSWNNTRVEATLAQTSSSTPNVWGSYGNYGQTVWDGAYGYSCSGGIMASGATVYGNSYWLDSSGYTWSMKRGVLVHEDGHVFGLSEYSGVASCGGGVYEAYAIMYPSTGGRKGCSGTYWTSPRADDKSGVNAIY